MCAFHKYGAMDKKNLSFKFRFIFVLPSEGLCNCITWEDPFFFPSIYVAARTVNAIFVVNGK